MSGTNFMCAAGAAIVSLALPIGASAQGPTCPSGMVIVHGIVGSVAGMNLTITTRNGTAVHVDIASAQAAGTYRPVQPGMPVTITAIRAPGGALLAQTVFRAKARPQAWGPDCP